MTCATPSISRDDFPYFALTTLTAGPASSEAAHGRRGNPHSPDTCASKSINRFAGQFTARTDFLQNLLDRLDGHSTALENLGEVISDAMKVTILCSALTALRVPPHVRVADAFRVSTVDLQLKNCSKMALDFGVTEASTGGGTDKGPTSRASLLRTRLPLPIG